MYSFLLLVFLTNFTEIASVCCNTSSHINLVTDTNVSALQATALNYFYSDLLLNAGSINEST
jgi:hypothetical protein